MTSAFSESEEVVLDGLAEVIAHGATEPFLAGPLILHEPAHFPDAWSGDLRSVRDALRRLLRHAGLPEVGVCLQDVRDGVDVGLEHGVLFDRLIGGDAHFSVAEVGPPERMVAPLALQIAKVWADWTGYGRSAAGPYRDDDDDEPEEVTDAAASLILIALGFGVIAVNGSAEMLKGETIDGAFVVGQWQLTQVGGLPPRPATFALAVHLVVRGVDGDDLDAIRLALGADHRRLLMKEVARLRPRASALAERLGLPARKTWPAPRPVDVTPLASDAEGDAELMAREREFQAELAVPNRDRVVFRVPRTSTIAGTMVGGVAGVAAATLLPMLGAMRPALVVVGAGIGYALGRRIRRAFCSDPACEHLIGEDIEHCPGCGGFVAGEIASANQRLAAEEAYEAEQAQLDAERS